MARYPLPFELPIMLDRAQPGLPRQLAEQIRGLVNTNRLQPGDPLPSTRTVAETLAVSRGTVTAAYEQLVGEGYLYSWRGGTTVHPQLPPALMTAVTPAPSTSTTQGSPSTPSAPDDTTPTVITEPQGDLRPSTPDVSVLTSTAWRAAWRRAAAQPSLGYQGAGSSALREQIAEHLRAVRAVAADPQDVVVTAGARDGLRLLITALAASRSTPLTVAVENPGYPSLHQVPVSLGHRVLPVEVDDQGVRIDALDELNAGYAPSDREGPVDLVLITPSHQYPLGSSMSATRRRELIRWAQQHDAVVVEDDYDSELRYVGDPLPALAAMESARGHQGQQGQRGQHVTTLGSFAKTVTPGLGLGYVLVPPQLREDVAALTAHAGTPVSGMVQDAMSIFMAEGGLRRHTARMRREYRRRRDVVMEVFAAGQVPDSVSVLPMDGGLHAVLQLKDAEHERRVMRAASGLGGLGIQALGQYWNRRAAPTDPTNTPNSTNTDDAAPMSGVVLGIGAASEVRLREQLVRLRSVLS